MFRRVLSQALLGFLILPLAVHAYAAPQDDDPRSFTVIKAKRVITVSGKDLEDATIVIRDGKIEAVGENVDYPFGAKVVDAGDMVIMPGMINPTSRVARLPGGAGATPHLDKSEDLTLTGKSLSEIASTGYTTLGLMSPGAPMPGRVLVIRTAGQKPQDLVMNGKGPVHISFNSPGSSKSAVLRAFASAKKEIEKLKKAKEAAAKKAAAAKKPAPKKDPNPKPGPKPAPKPTPKPTPKPAPKPAPKPKAGEALADPPKGKPATGATAKLPKINPTWEPLVELIEKKKGATAIVEFGNNRESLMRATPTAASMYVHWSDVLKEYEFAHSFRIFNTVVAANSPFFVTAETNVDKVAAEIGKKKPYIALYPVVNHHPFTRDKYNLGLLLHSKGARAVYIPQDDRWSSYAGMRDDLARMVRAGFPKSEILKTVTVNPAKMLGIGDQVGTIESGRTANLVFLSGDPLAFDTKVEKVMIDGKFIELKRRLR